MKFIAGSNNNAWRPIRCSQKQLVNGGQKFLARLTRWSLAPRVMRMRSDWAHILSREQAEQPGAAPMYTRHDTTGEIALRAWGLFGSAIIIFLLSPVCQWEFYRHSYIDWELETMPDEFYGDETLLTFHEIPSFSLLAMSIKLMVFNAMKPSIKLSLTLA